MSLYQNFLQQIGRLASIPAGAIDRIYIEEPRDFLATASQFLRIRLFYLAFIALAAVDMVSAGLMAVGYAFRTFFTSEDEQDSILAEQKKYATLTGKSFYALLGSIVGIFMPKLVVFYFTPEHTSATGVSAGGGYHHAPDAEVQQPETPEELQHMVKQALADGRQIIAKGAGRSQGKQFLPDGNGKTPLVIDLQKMNVVEIDSTTKTATVGAGALWSDLQIAADKSRMAVKVMQASNVFSVGGSIGSNIHGWDFKSGMLSNTIESMDIINTKGEFETITPNDKLFHHITGGLGLFGIVYNVTIQLAKNEKLERHGADVAPEDYVSYFKNHVENNADNRLHLYRLSLDPKHLLSKGFAESYMATDNQAYVTPNFSTEAPNGTRLDRILVNIARRFGWARKLWWDGERQKCLDNNPVQTTNQIMQASINAMFNPSVSEAEWLQEYFLPGDKLTEFLNEFAQMMMDNDVTLLNASVRHVKQNEKSPLSYAKDGERFAVVICFNQSLQPTDIIKAKKWLRQAQHLSVEKGGSYYLPYQHVSSPEDFDKSFPDAHLAQAYKDEIDPDHHFTSGLHQKYMVPKGPDTSYIKRLIASPELKQSFKGFLENILKRVDSEKIYALLEDILTYNDTHAEIYQELCNRLHEIMPSTVGDISNKLSSLAAIKQDLGAQARTLLPSDLVNINGIVEIGSPGRFATGFKEHYNVTGKIVAVNESQGVGDYIDAGSFHPYDQFVTLDCNNIDLSQIADNSADVMTCYIGLHHFPEDKLDAFLIDAKRILRNGGHFLLVEHDVGDEHSDSFAMANLAHFIFNAVNGVPLADEINEIRDFRPLAYWQAKLTEHGLNNGLTGPNVPLIRQGDPTLNRMVVGVNAEPNLINTCDVSLQSPVPADTLAPINDNPQTIGDWRASTASETTVSSMGIFAEDEDEEHIETNNNDVVPAPKENTQCR